MYYSIYPKLRAIYSFLPTEKEIEYLIKAKGLSGYNSRVRELNILKRFPLKGINIERHFSLIPFELGKMVYDRLFGSPKDFFHSYMKIYELKDIKAVLRGGMSCYQLYLERENLDFSEIDDSMKKGFWEEAWRQGYSRYRETERISDIEIPLDHYYYKILLKTSQRLPSSDRTETGELILSWIDLINQVWIYRLRQFYGMKWFEIKRFLIPEGNVYQNIEEAEGLSRVIMIKECSRICYRGFKMRMFTMKAILAFFILLDFKMEKIISIYSAKLLNMEEDRLKKIIGVS